MVNPGLYCDPSGTRDCRDSYPHRAWQGYHGEGPGQQPDIRHNQMWQQSKINATGLVTNQQDQRQGNDHKAKQPTVATPPNAAAQLTRPATG